MVQACFTIPTRTARRRASTRRRAPPRRRAPVRRARTYSRRTTRPSRSARRQRQLTKYELVNMNPFDQRCLGVKIPDSNTQPSETTVDDNRWAMTVDASQNASARAFLPLVDYNTVVGVPAGSSSWTWPAGFAGANASSNASNIKGEFVGIRPVGHGVRLSCPLAPLNVTGFVHVCIVPQELYFVSTWQFPTTVGQMANLPWYRRFTLAQLTQRSVTVVNKFLDQSATRYVDADGGGFASAGTNEFQFGNSWCAVIVAVESAPALSTALTVETIVHYEGLTKLGTTNDSTPAAEYSVRQLQDVSRIATTHPGTFMEGEEDSLIAGAMRDLFGVVSNYAGSYNSVPAGLPGITNNRLTGY